MAVVTIENAREIRNDASLQSITMGGAKREYLDSGDAATKTYRAMLSLSDSTAFSTIEDDGNDVSAHYTDGMNQGQIAYGFFDAVTLSGGAVVGFYFEDDQ